MTVQSTQLRGVIFSRNSALQQADYTQISSLFAQLRMFTTVQLGIAKRHTFSEKVTLVTTFISTLHLSGQCTLLTTQHTSMVEQMWQLKETWTDVSLHYKILWTSSNC